MNSKILIAIAFLLVAAAQIYIPAEMINGREAVIANGKMFKFNTEPVDPADVMRGRYINLNFRNNTTQVISDSTYIDGQEGYVLLEQDLDGFASIRGISKTEPTNTDDYLKVKINIAYSENDTTVIFIDYPFNRYYMEESKAPQAEELYAESQRDTSATTYAIVMIKDGEGVLTDLMINDRSISELVEEMTK